jgi:iron complex outermembrane receptor protein
MVQLTARTMLLAGCAAGCLLTEPAFAQAGDGLQLEEITVTARRREEVLQSTPVSVSALSSAQIEQQRVLTVDRLSQITPNVALAPAGGSIAGTVAYIRGIGNADPILAIDQAVGIYLDGVYIARSNAGNFDLVDLQRVEVLRGPQGTLFGRNTTGGAINLVTKAPSAEFGATAKLEYAQGNQLVGLARINTGEIGGTGIAATVSYQRRQRDGFVDNPYAPDSKDPGALDSDAIWTRVHGDWGDFSADYAFDYNKQQGRPAAYQIVAATQTVRNYYGRSTALGGDPFFVQAGRSGTVPLALRNPQRTRSYGHAFTLEYDVSQALRFKSISAYRKIFSYVPTIFVAADLRGIVSAAGAVAHVQPSETDRYIRQRQYSQELQLLGSVDRLDYVFGFYYFDERGRDQNTSFSTRIANVAGVGLVGTNATSLTDYKVHGTSYAGFGQASYKPPILDDRLELTVGLRYTIDKKRAQQLSTIARSGNRTFHNTAYNVTLNFQATDDLMLYGRVGTGYRSGGFNTRAAATGNFLFEPEKAMAYEAGIKSEWFDKRLRWNAAVFYTDYKDLQVNQFTGITPGGGSGFTSNAQAHFQGFEGEVQAIVVRGLTVDGSIGYTKAVYDEIFFPNPANNVITNYAAQAHVPYVPKWTTHIGVQYEFPPMEMGTWSVRADYSWNSTRYFHTINLSNVNPFNNEVRDPGQKLLSGRITLGDIAVGPRAKLELSVWGENLLNKDIVTGGVDFGASGFGVQVFGQPRRIGGSARIVY